MKTNPIKVRFVWIAFALAPCAANAHKVIGISDGDTITVLVDQKPLTIRLANIDAPEKNQSFGQRSKQSLSDLCWGKDAQYDAKSVDRYGRTVAIVRCGGIEVNRAQVQKGMAWVYPKYNTDASLPDLELAARNKKSGIWSEKNPVAPWEFRHAVTSPQDTVCHTGPRGGHYRIVNGRKQYGCK
ncbi:thermonuclease family protein [Herbaspirillum huttiense]|uniref:thermonuclease family protein n=1 Tax=Herbaspirillum huttiense TaxID=863372 RepID=UPI0010665717|nr:thermonuclease family protein [Herbaspirillum huttiense]QBP75375.1 thermonuclease family protein [Herbaspirillum huttiense]